MFQGLENTIGNIFNNFKQTVSPVISDITGAGQELEKNLQQTVAPITQTVNPKNLIQPIQVHPLELLGQLANIHPDLKSPTLHSKTEPVPKLHMNPGNTGQIIKAAQDYGKYQVEQPVIKGIQSLTNPNSSLAERGLGALSTAGGVFSATPPGAAFNIGFGGLSGLSQAIRQHKDIGNTILSDISHPTSFAQSGLGINNPWIALAVDVGVTRNPKSMTKDIGGIKAAVTDLGKSAAKKKLTDLITYDDRLAQEGYTQAQRNKLSVNKAQELFQYDQKTAEDTLNQARYYATEKKNTFNQLFNQWYGKRQAAQTTAYQVSKQFTNIPESLGWDVIRLIENPKAKVSPEAKRYVPAIKAEYDRLFQDAKDSGVDVHYLSNYITHLFKENETEVAAKLGAGQTFKFAQKRVLPNYETAIAKGLTPRYTHPAPILATYVQNLEKLKANIDFVKQLKKEGIIVDTAIGHGTEMKPIIASGFPQSAAKNFSGGVVKGHFYAPAPVADTINRIFEEQPNTLGNKALNITSALSGALQNFHLAGGIPGTPANMFSTTAGLQKEFNAGRYVDPTVAFLRSFSQGATRNYFEQNAETIKAMQRQGIELHTELNIGNIIPQGWIDRTFSGDVYGGIRQMFRSAFDDPTFKRFWPSMQIEFFKNIQNSAMQDGKTSVEAEEIAAKATKNFYGIIDSGVQARRSKTMNQLLTIGFFAPRYRESIVHVITNALKAVSPVKLETQGLKITGINLNNPMSLENRYLSRFVAGTVINYWAMDQLNRHYNGHGMIDNPPTKQNYLLIPLSKITGDPNNTTVLEIPFLPSIGTIPRSVFQAGYDLATGNRSNLAQDARKNLSVLMQPFVGVATGQDYFGRSLDTGNPLKDYGLYSLQEYQHPFMAPFTNQLMPKQYQQSPAQLALQAAEVPASLTTTGKLQSAIYYGAKDKAYQQLNPNEQRVYDQISLPNTTNDPRQTMAEAQLRLQYPNVLKAESDVAKQERDKGIRVDPFYILPPSAQQVILNIQALPPGDSTKSQLEQNNAGWLNQYYKDHGDFINYTLKQQGKQPLQSDRPIADAALQAKLDHYDTLPSGTGARTKYLNANPDVLNFFQQSEAYTNLERAKLGLPSNDYSYSGSHYTPYNRFSGTLKKKISVSAPKIPTTKIAAVKHNKLALKTTGFKIDENKLKNILKSLQNVA